MSIYHDIINLMSKHNSIIKYDKISQWCLHHWVHYYMNSMICEPV